MGYGYRKGKGRSVILLLLYIVIVGGAYTSSSRTRGRWGCNRASIRGKVSIVSVNKKEDYRVRDN